MAAQGCRFYLRMSFPAAERIIKAIILITTTVAPVGVEKKYDTISPDTKHTIEITADKTTTDLKYLHTRIAVKAGKIIRLEISRAPIILIPRTMVIDVKTAISILYTFALIPVAFANVSSKVTAKILL